MKGYEYLRILEYRLAILSDKCEYLGEKATSDTERKLAKLVHFPPLNYTCYPAVPAKYIVPMEDPWNPTEEAMDVMEELVKEVVVAAKIPEISWKKNEQMDCPTITSGETCGGCRLAK